MSLRDKTSAVLEKGREERGNFAPEAGSVPVRLYKYWAGNAKSSKVPERENFCHFWRVVAIWAPLMFVKNTVIEMGTSTSGLIFFGLIALAAIAYGGFASADFAMLLAALAGTVVMVAGALFGGIAAAGPEKAEVPVKVWQFSWLSFLIALPAALLGFLGTKIVMNWNRKWNKYIQNTLLGLGLATMAVAIGSVLVLSIMEEGWIFLLWLGLGALALLVGAAVIGITGSLLADYISGKRAKRRAEKDAAWEAYWAGEGPNPAPTTVREPREPGRISKFFSGLGDLIVFTAQVIRTKKWKICPMVEIPE